MFDKDNKFGFINNNESNNSNSSDIKKYIDDNTVIHPLPVYEISENPSMITYIVNIMDLKKLTTYGAIRDMNSTKYQRYRFVYICDDGKKKTIVNTGDDINDTTFRVYHYGTSSTLTFNNKIYSINYTNHNTSTDVIVTESIQKYLGIYNTQEYTPTENYHPSTKKYVDDKIKTDLGDEELTTVNKNVKGAINEVNAQYKDIVKQTMTEEERTKLNSLNNYDDTTIKNDIQTQKARIDSFTSLKEGSTTGDAELIDARIDTDGNTYSNLGNAIRNKTAYLENLLKKSNIVIKSELIDDSKDSREKGYLNHGTLVSNSGYNTNFYDVSENDKIAINGVYIKNKKFYVVEFLDSNGSYVSEINNGDDFLGAVNNFRLTVPENAKKMAVTTAIGTFDAIKFNKDSINVILENDTENISSIKDDVNELNKKFLASTQNINHWYGKKVVWLGTSVSFGANATTSYAVEVCNKLGINLVNTSVPGLAIHINENGEQLTNGSVCLSKAEYNSQGRVIPDSPLPYIPGGTYNDYYRTWENIFTSENADADLWVFDVIPNNTNFDTTDYDNFDRNNWVYKDGKSFEEHRKTFLGALIFLLDKLYTLNPKARVVMLAGSNFSRNPGKTAFELLQSGALHYPFIDLWGKVGYNIKTQSYLYSKNGTDMHPSTEAHKIMGNIAVGEFLGIS